MGWNLIRHLAKLHDVWVITRANNRRTIETASTDGATIQWVYFDLPSWTRFWKRGTRGVNLYYYLWQIGAYDVARQLHRAVRFDVTHHVTFVKYWMPSFLSILPDPFVWGPVGGGESAPKRFFFDFGLKGMIFELTRGAVRALGEADPFVRLTARRSRAALASTGATAERLSRLGAKHVQTVSQVALSADELALLRSLPGRAGSSPFRLVSMGRLLPLKGFHLALRAFAAFSHAFPAAEYWVVGNGPDRRRLQTLAERMGVAGKVVFAGLVPRERALNMLGECDVLVHPSLHDSGGWVCLEAMAAGRPVICLDLGGPAILVTDETGIKVPAVDPDQAVRDLTQAMVRLARDRDLRCSMGEAGQQRVEQYFRWDRKAEQFSHLYEQIEKPWT